MFIKIRVVAGNISMAIFVNLELLNYPFSFIIPAFYCFTCLYNHENYKLYIVDKNRHPQSLKATIYFIKRDTIVSKIKNLFIFLIKVFNPVYEI